MTHDAQHDDALRRSARPDSAPVISSDAWPAFGAVTVAPPGAPAASAIGALTDGPVRVIVVARSTYAAHAPAEAERAVTVALAAARTMLGATAHDLDATQAALPRGIVNRWRSSRPSDLPPVTDGQGTSLLVAMSSGAGARLTGFGSGYAVALGSDGVLDPLDLAPQTPPEALTADAPASADSSEESATEGSEEVAIEPLPPVGLDGPAAGVQVVQRRISGSRRARLIWLSVGPPPPVGSDSSLWAPALVEIADRLKSESTSGVAVQPSSPHSEADDSLPALGEPTTGPDLDVVMAPADGDPDALQPLPDWLPDLLPESVSAAVFMWPGADGAPLAVGSEAAGASARSSSNVHSGTARSASSSQRRDSPRSSSGVGRRRWSLVLLAAALVAGLALAAWAWARGLQVGAPPAPSATASVDMRSSPPSRPSPSATASSSSASPTTSVTPTETPTPRRAAPMNTQRYVPPARPAPSTSPTLTDPAPSSSSADTSAPSATSPSPSTPTPASTETSTATTPETTVATT